MSKQQWSSHVVNRRKTRSKASLLTVKIQDLSLAVRNRRSLVHCPIRKSNSSEEPQILRDNPRDLSLDSVSESEGELESTIRGDVPTSSGNSSPGFLDAQSGPSILPSVLNPRVTEPIEESNLCIPTAPPVDLSANPRVQPHQR